MKLLKPSWVSHDEKPIFAIDIHPAGVRFATGGQGGDSGRVVVWSLSAVLQESSEQDPTVPKMLCQMDNHLACVNCVRWSCGGQYLASGGDDKLVMIWRMSGSGSSAVFGGNGKHNVESWRCIATLRGHAGDILDLAWSPLDKWLVSCSVDNSIIVWNAEKFPEMVCVLNGHSGLVKGVAWDPVGKYLASQSDDKTLRIWKTADWTQEAVVTEPFEECGGTTHVLRLSWSPDGQYVVSAHAMNGGGPTAQIVERDGWRCDKDFVGHRKAVTCVRFNSNILGRWLEGGGRGPTCYCCAAIGSRDRSLSVWCTALKRPLVVIHELFTDSVLDLSWSKDGLNLLACSWDGTVACIQFTKKEIGLPLSTQEKNALYERMYGKSLACASDNDTSANLLVECPQILKVRDELEKKEASKAACQIKTESKIKPAVSNSNSAEDKTPVTINTSLHVTSSNSALISPVRPMNRQIETRTSDGKRRITPMFIPLNHPVDHNESFTNATNTDGCFSSSSQAKSKIIVEKRDDIIIIPNVSNHASVVPPATQGPNTFIGVTKPPLENQLDSRLKRRGTDALPGPKLNDVAKKQKFTPVREENAIVKSITVQDTGGRLATPTLGTAGPIVRHAGKFRVQVLNNACNTPHGKLSRIQLLPGNSASNDPIWETFLGSPCNSIACDATWICIGCEDATLHTLETATGQREVGTIALGAPAARLSLVQLSTEKGGTHLCAITTAASLTVWNMTERCSVMTPISLRYLMPDSVSVASVTLTDDGSPMVSLTNGKGYIYSKKMSTWVLGCDGADPLWRCARGGLGRPLASAPPTAPITLLQHNTLRGRLSSSQQSHYQQGSYHAGAVQSYLEGQLANSKLIESPTEYKHWLIELASHLLQHGPEVRLRNILDDLMGPSHCTSKSKSWKVTTLGLDKHLILDDILAIIVKHLRWQRLYIEYSEQLSRIKEKISE